MMGRGKAHTKESKKLKLPASNLKETVVKHGDLATNNDKAKSKIATRSITRKRKIDTPSGADCGQTTSTNAKRDKPDTTGTEQGETSTMQGSKVMERTAVSKQKNTTTTMVAFEEDNNYVSMEIGGAISDTFPSEHEDDESSRSQHSPSRERTDSSAERSSRDSSPDTTSSASSTPSFSSDSESSSGSRRRSKKKTKKIKGNMPGETKVAEGQGHLVKGVEIIARSSL